MTTKIATLTDLTMKKLICMVVPTVLVAGCAGPQVAPRTEVPFHVALKPVDVRVQSVEWEGEAPELVLSITDEAASEQLRKTLLEGCFAKVTLLKYPDKVDPAAFNSDEATANRYWVKAARAAGADVLADCTLQYQDVVASGTNDFFLPNLGLFLIGGPLNYFPNDRTYTARADLIAVFYEMNVLTTGEGDPPFNSAQLARFQAPFDDVNLDFIDRASGIGSYALSLVCPAGLLARENEKVQRRVQESVIEQTATELRHQIVARREEFNVAPSQPFWFELAPPGINSVGANEYMLDGRVILRKTVGRDSMATYELVAGSEKHSGSFDESPDTVEGDGVGTFLSFPLKTRFRSAAGAPTVQLVLTEASSNRAVRTYTFGLDREAL